MLLKCCLLSIDIFPALFSCLVELCLILRLGLSEAVVQRCSVKKVFLEIRKVHMKTSVQESLLLNLY